MVTICRVRAREAPPAAADAEREVALVRTVGEFDINLQVGDGAGEGGVDLTDEGRVGDHGVLIADDARIVGGRGRHHEGRDDRRGQGLLAEVLDEVLRRRLADAGREAARVEAEERITHQIGDARARARRAQDHDRVFVGGQSRSEAVRCN